MAPAAAAPDERAEPLVSGAPPPRARGLRDDPKPLHTRMQGGGEGGVRARARALAAAPPAAPRSAATAGAGTAWRQFVNAHTTSTDAVTSCMAVVSWAAGSWWGAGAPPTRARQRQRQTPCRAPAGADRCHGGQCCVDQPSPVARGRHHGSVRPARRCSRSGAACSPMPVLAVAPRGADRTSHRRLRLHARRVALVAGNIGSPAPRRS